MMTEAEIVNFEKYMFSEFKIEIELTIMKNNEIKGTPSLNNGLDKSFDNVMVFGEEIFDYRTLKHKLI